jgi:adenine-specific DNA methylase
VVPSENEAQESSVSGETGTGKAAVPVNFRITDDDLGVGGAKSKYAANVAALQLLFKLEEEDRLATADEQEVLSRYVGWGSLAEVFDDNAASDKWASEHIELKALLPESDYASARATTLNAHYTSPIVIKAMYAAIEQMGFKGGNILEPSCGIGNFMGLIPEEMARASKFFGVEIDALTGRIAKQLYQEADIAISGFEDKDYPDNFFDIAIGNVPFGSYGVVDRKYDRHKFLIHDYFFAKALDKVRPGGVVAFITSKGTLDKKNSSVRRYLAQRAELIGAIRLPNNAFLANAGTGVTSDILFLQKRDRIVRFMDLIQVIIIMETIIKTCKYLKIIMMEHINICVRIWLFVVMSLNISINLKNFFVEFVLLCPKMPCCFWKLLMLNGF